MILNYDRKIKIAAASTIRSLVWPEEETTVGVLYERLGTPIRGRETMAEFLAFTDEEKKRAKDVGAFVGGSFADGRRSKDKVLGRDLITLDFDDIPEEAFAKLLSDIENLGVSTCIYSTRKHTMQHPRIRIVIPAARTMTVNEFEAVSRKVADELGIFMADKVSFEPNQAMYWPSVSADGVLFYRVIDKPLLQPEEWLQKYGPDDAWKKGNWPLTLGETKKIAKACKKKGDPRKKAGLMGVFNRAYSVPEAIETFLQDVYEKAGEDRYKLIASDSPAGARVYEEGKYLYSNHSNSDPCYGHCYSAYDVVRIHKFGNLDKEAAPDTPVNRLPSTLAMNQFCRKDKRVAAIAGAAVMNEDGSYSEARRDDSAGADSLNDDSPNYDFIITNRGEPTGCIYNVHEILTKHPDYKGKIRLNRFTERIEVCGELPWSRNADNPAAWTDADLCQLTMVCEQWLKNCKKTMVADAVAAVADENAFHPVKDYFESLPPWDGVERLDRCLVEYMGADDSEYTRAVTRKSFTACVARIYQPGIKYDTMLLLVGKQGIGKSSFLGIMGGDWFCDSLTSFGDKDSMEKVQNAWLIEIGELAALSKADVNAAKNFMTSQADRFRPAYGRYSIECKRHCVFFGSTNERLCLRDYTGNRRYLILDCKKDRIIKQSVRELPAERDLLWAEAYYRYQQGEPLFLDEALTKAAEIIQEDHRVAHPWEDIIADFLNESVPDTWLSWNNEQRFRYLRSAYPDKYGANYGNSCYPHFNSTGKRCRVCAMEIWVEALRKDQYTMDIKEARIINSLLDRLPDWEYAGVLNCGKSYGKQRCYKRKT